MFLPGSVPRPCSYEVMAGAGCPRRRPTGHFKVSPARRRRLVYGSGRRRKYDTAKRALPLHCLRKVSRFGYLIISVGVMPISIEADRHPGI